MSKAQLEFDAPLLKLNSWHVGGNAECLYKPADLAGLVSFIKNRDHHQLTWLGLGSNVLIRDNGIAGTVIVTTGRLAKMSLIDDGVVRVEAGVTSAKFAKFCAKNSLGNASFFAGVPGTVGGALAMNAGAFGGETWPHVVSAEMMNDQGEIIVRQADEFDVAYRHVNRLDKELVCRWAFSFS